MGQVLTTDWLPAWFPDMNAPVVQIGKLPVITRSMLIWAVIGLLIWVIVLLTDRNKHNGHRDRSKKLRKELHRLEERFDRHFPPTPSASSSAPPV
jgi:hypothetical protein